MNLRNVSIIGFFSLPSATLAEHNPSAYNAAMASAPEGAGTCSHCGNGIRHHVVIRDECGVVRFIGTDCAVKVGCDSDSIRYRMTSDQLAERNAKRDANLSVMRAENEARIAAEKARLAIRRESVGELVDMLRSMSGDFYPSLAAQLENGPLSYRQAEYVAKATSATGRRNKRNAEAFDRVIELCCER